MSVIDAEYYFDEDSLFRELPESSQQVLADRLMPASAWKLVADRLGFAAIDIEMFAAKSSSQSAYQMLREWSWRNGSTLRVLRQTLDNIGRMDIIVLIDDIRKRKCTLYFCFRKKRGSAHHVDIRVEGRKSLCRAVTSALTSFADDHYRRPAVNFELQFGVSATWITEAHHFQGQQINVEVSAHQLDGRNSYRSVDDRMLLLDDKNLVVTETLRTSPPALSRQVSLSVPETTLPSIDLQSDLNLSDSEVARNPSTVVKEVMTPADRSESGFPAMNPIRFDGSGGGRGGGQQMDVVGIRTELDALPGYHRNVRNRNSSVCPPQGRP